MDLRKVKLLKSMTGASPETRMILLLWIAMRRELYVALPSEYAKYLGVSKRSLMKAIDYLLSEGYIEEVPGLSRRKGRKRGSGYDISCTSLQWFEESVNEIFLKDYFYSTLYLNINGDSQKLSLEPQVLLLVLISTSDQFSRVYNVDYEYISQLTGLKLENIKYNLSTLVNEGFMRSLVVDFKPKGRFSVIDFVYEVMAPPCLISKFNFEPSLLGCNYESSYFYFDVILRDLSLIYDCFTKDRGETALSERNCEYVFRKIMTINDKYRHVYFVGFLHYSSKIGHVIFNDKKLKEQIFICHEICIEKHVLLELNDDELIDEIVSFLKRMFPYDGSDEFKPDMLRNMVSIYSVYKNKFEFIKQCKDVNGLSNMGLFYHLWAESMLPFIKSLSSQLRVLSESKSLKVEAIRCLPKSKAVITQNLVVESDVTAVENGIEEKGIMQHLAVNGVVEFFCGNTGSVKGEYCVLGKDVYENNSRVNIGQQNYEIAIKYN
ncbi:hypothetical protein [Shewanella halifaxensis]|uniref:hypothetical protein n=1 Tax=Shewanella halifaxensis TaxID=271098 RepID=UPI000D5A1E66|nr:hypothetical protein [Shewanella halifaxensis]